MVDADHGAPFPDARPRLVPPRFVAKPWGVDALPAPFAAADQGGEKIGEVWFDPPPECPDVLIKFLYTSTPLSVQVHPSDAQAAARGEGAGKEECWLILGAGPDAVLRIGIEAEIDSEGLEAAARDGSIEDILGTIPVRPDDFFYIAAGTVHAIGAGLALLEIQQTSDTTYRLYDYGSDRALHLDEARAVATIAPYPMSAHRRVAPDRSDDLVGPGRPFRVRHLGGAFVEDTPAEATCLAVCLNGAARAGSLQLAAGQCAVVPPGTPVSGSPAARVIIARGNGTRQET